MQANHRGVGRGMTQGEEGELTQLRKKANTIQKPQHEEELGPETTISSSMRTRKLGISDPHRQQPQLHAGITKELSCPLLPRPDLPAPQTPLGGLPWRLRRWSFCLQCGRPGFNPRVGKILWRRKWQPTPVLLPGKCHGRRSLVGYSAWDGKELDTTEQCPFSDLATSPEWSQNSLGLDPSINIFSVPSDCNGQPRLISAAGNYFHEMKTRDCETIDDHKQESAKDDENKCWQKKLIMVWISDWTWPWWSSFQMINFPAFIQPLSSLLPSLLPFL